ncbi:hypothetical protein SDJN02_09570, partial [Cucurbita argyrosperma subsp. argyrosperma]
MTFADAAAAASELGDGFRFNESNPVSNGNRQIDLLTNNFAHCVGYTAILRICHSQSQADLFHEDPFPSPPRHSLSKLG